MVSLFLSPGPQHSSPSHVFPQSHMAELPVAQRPQSGQSLEEQDLLINAEPVQHHHQVLATAGDLALHGQAEVFLHAFGDAPSDRVVLDQHSLIWE